MITNFVHKILHAIHKHRTLDSANQAYTRGKGVHRDKNKITRLIKQRIQNPLYNGGQDKTSLGKGVNTACFHAINNREDAQEKQAPQRQSSFDLVKAFDSTSKPAMMWSWQRIGVPKGAAN